MYTELLIEKYGGIATLTDSRAADLADLVRSAVEPGLKERIREYRKG